MRYASIRQMDISNGEGIGVALFVQGCHFHCFNCFNPNTWDFNGGKEFDLYEYDTLIKAVKQPFIQRISFLGGEPLCPENRAYVTNISNMITTLCPTKTQWLYTGYKWEEIKNLPIMEYLDVVVDGQYEDDKRDITLKWRGSSNQRVIDVQKSLADNTVRLYCE